jgi:hypothetical protein
MIPQREDAQVKHRVMLTVMSLMSVVLFSIHVIDDIVHGFDQAGIQNAIGILILVVWSYGALVLVERRSGLIILLLGGILATGVPLLHLRGAVVSSRAFAQSPGAFLFLWTLWALGTTGAFSVILAASGLRGLQLGKRGSTAAGA